MKRTSPFVLLALSALLLASVGGPAPALAGKPPKKTFVEKNAPKVDKLLGEARELIDAGDLDKAMRKLDRARDLSRFEDPRPFFVTSEVLLLQDHPDRAAKNAERGLEVVSSENPSLAADGWLLVGEGYLAWYRQIEAEGGTAPSLALAQRAEKGFSYALDNLTANDARRSTADAGLAQARGILDPEGARAAEAEEMAEALTAPTEGSWLDGFGRPVTSVIERPDWGRAFAAREVEGTFVLYDPASSRLQIFNPEEAARRKLPASTYKIPNTLIVLETGVVESVDEVLPWDGFERDFPAWNRDHSLRTALPNSVVWFYQEVARRIGAERMQAWVDRFDYGNRNIGGELDLFWLTGDLAISPLEQVDFLTRLQGGRLPVSQRSLDILRELLVQPASVIDVGGDWVLRAKTGWANFPDPDIAWYVGWAERGDDVRVFALRIDMDEPEKDRVHRVALVEELLRAELH